MSNEAGSAPVAVTGTTGKLGGRIARLLADRGAHQLLVGRDPSAQPRLPNAAHRGPAEYGDGEAMRSALEGASRLLLVSGNLSGRRLEEHTAAIDAAIAVGVEQIVYVSLLGAAEHATYINARDHWQTEQVLAGAGVPFTALRPSFYASMLPGLADDAGVIRGPAGDGRVSAVAHDDLAEVAAAVLLADTGRFDGAILPVTGPEAVTPAEAAATIERVTGRPFRFVPETVEDARGWREQLDATPEQIDGWISWYRAIAAGDVSEVSDVVERVTGHAAIGLEEALRRDVA